MNQYSTSDLSRKSGDIIADALRSPVTITQRNKPRLVLMSVDMFEKMQKRGDTRVSYRIEETPPELWEAMRAELDRLEAEEPHK